mmetsp:Transcript_91133/g.178361  ORF Transcript_91133/g.178361 Transcript_91133/m.178361 type:complete len:130 (+) Transcript_91133:336-725(+)
MSISCTLLSLLVHPSCAVTTSCCSHCIEGGYSCWVNYIKKIHTPTAIASSSKCLFLITNSQQTMYSTTHFIPSIFLFTSTLQKQHYEYISFFLHSNILMLLLFTPSLHPISTLLPYGYHSLHNPCNRVL